MRKVWSKWLAVAVLAVGMMATMPAKAQGVVSLQVFYDELQPYGTWVDHGRYGYVWMPHAGSDFVPYGSNGYWVQTGYGNTWVSNYSWGWAPFHYGRWFYDDFYGWLWTPDTTWGPAWVAWRSGGGFYGWAPLMPGLNVSVAAGYYDHIPHNYWNFVPYRYVMYHQVYRHCVPGMRATNIMQHTTVIVNNNYYDHDGPSNGRSRSDGRDRSTYFTGPTRSEIEHHNGERIPTYQVHERNTPGGSAVSRTSVSMYKPAVEQSTGRRTLPTQFTRDDAQGRDNIQQMRTRQTREREQTRETLDNNQGTLRRSQNGAPAGRTDVDGNRTFPGNDRSNSSNNVEGMRREANSPDFERGIDNLRERSSRSTTSERTDRDVEFNKMQQQRESESLRRQQTESQQRDRLNQQETNSPDRRQAQPAPQQSQQPEIRQQRQPRSVEMPRQSAPARESNQQLQQRSPSQRQQQLAAPAQRQSGGQQVRTAPSRSSSQPSQRSGSQRSGSATHAPTHSRSSGRD